LTERREAREGLRGSLKLSEIQIGHSESPPSTSAVTRVDRHDPFWAVDRQAANHRVDDCEHRPVHADTERQCKDGRQGEPNVFQQQTSGKPEILRAIAHPPRSTRIAATLLERIISAKIETCAATGLLLGHSHPNVVSHLTIEVIPKLGVEFTLESIVVPKALPPIH
jgi:hypothetical protein